MVERKTRIVAPRKPAPGQSLADLHPGHAAEWDMSRNDGLAPSDVMPSSNFRAWWKCGNCGMQWDATVDSRARSKVNCAACVRRANAGPAKPEPGQSLADLYPEHAAEWDMEKNGDLTPFDVKPKSESRVWWKCGLCGKSWEGVVSVRSDSQPHCKDCAHRIRRMPAPGQSLADLHPDHAAEWHRSKNGRLKPSDVKASTGRPAWWECWLCGEVWSASIASRTASALHCRKCRADRGPKKPKPGRSLAERYPDHATEWDLTGNGGLAPSDVSARSDYEASWRCRLCSASWRQKCGVRTLYGLHCNACRRRQRGQARSLAAPNNTRGRSLADAFPGVAKMWHPDRNGKFTPEVVNQRSPRRWWWICEFSHEFAQSVENMVRSKSVCPECPIAIRKYGDWKITHPWMVGLWDEAVNGPIPEECRVSDVWYWRCGQGHQWRAPITSMRRRKGCGACYRESLRRK